MPEGWDKDTFSKFNNGEPAVVYMEYDPSYYPFDTQGGVDGKPNFSRRREPSQPASVDTALGRIRDALSRGEGQALDDAGITIVLPDSVPS